MPAASWVSAPTSPSRWKTVFSRCAGRLAWAHDFDPDRSIGATFQTLTASAEWKWINGWSAAATFEGEFSKVTQSYAGKGVARYAW
jgi:hypothetical protein